MNIDKKAVEGFLDALFKDHLATHGGYIEIRQINNGNIKQIFYTNIQDIIEGLDQLEGNIYFGIAPRIEKGGKKGFVKYLTCLWVDIDVSPKHKKETGYPTKENALEQINNFRLKPSIIVNSGNGFHLYWLLEKSIGVDLVRVESILDGLIKELQADNCGDINRIFRLPGTINLKNPRKPKKTKILFFDKDIKYILDDFTQEEELGEKLDTEVDLSQVVFDQTLPKIDFDMLRRSGIAPTVLATIKDGDFLERYPSRSERDQAAIFELLLNHFTHEQIKAIFNNPNYAVSDRYLELGRRGDTYLKRSILRAKQEIEKKKLFIEKPRTKKVNIPKGTYKMINKYMPRGEVLLPIDQYKETIENKNCVIFRKTDKIKDGEEIREYIIHKDIVDQNTKIELEYLQQAYISSVYLAQTNRTDTIEFNLQDKIDGIFYPGNKKISGDERQKRALAEKLLFYTTYRRYTKIKQKEIESLQHLYAGLEETRNASGHICYKIELNKMYLKEMVEGTGLIDPKISGGYIQLSLPLREPGNGKDRRIRYSLQKLKTLLRYRETDNPYCKYNVLTHLKAIGVKDYELKRKGLCKKIWAYIEPTFKQAGHKIVRKLTTCKDREDVRGWTLTIERGMVFRTKFTESPTTKAESPTTKAESPTTKAESPTTKNDLFKEGENQE